MPFVKPAPGFLIPDPDRHDMLPADGRNVPASDFWLRRLRDGDVVEATEPAEPAAPAALRNQSVSPESDLIAGGEAAAAPDADPSGE